jgi:DNA-binding transcriptional ArsR family regulator
MWPCSAVHRAIPAGSCAPSFVLTCERRTLILRHVPKYSRSLDRIFHALGDGSRRAMVERLAGGPASVSELARPFDMALPTVVQHLGVLETAGIVTSTKVGRVRTYQLAAEALTPAADWISRQRLPAERRLDRLGTFLTGTDKETTT